MATETLRPNGVGTYTEISYQWPASGAHWDKVDEVTHDGSTTMVYEGSTSYDRDLYATSHSIPVGSTINSVTVYAVLAYTGGAYLCYIGFRDSIGDWWDTGRNPTDVYALYDTGVRTTRSDGGAWTLADIDALEIGVKLRGNPSLSYYSQCTQVYVVVDYTAGGAQTFYQTLPATAIGVATLSRIATFYRTLSVVAAGVATMPKMLTKVKTLTATAIGVATLSKAATFYKTLSATTIGVATLSAARIFYKTLSATAVGIASLVAQKIEAGLRGFLRKVRAGSY